MTQTYMLEEVLYMALDFARSLAEREPSRERSLMVTRLEEAVMWNDACRVALDLPALGLHWRST